MILFVSCRSPKRLVVNEEKSFTQGKVTQNVLVEVTDHRHMHRTVFHRRFEG